MYKKSKDIKLTWSRPDVKGWRDWNLLVREIWDWDREENPGGLQLKHQINCKTSE